jgi:formate dehydrogenase subunit gamma
MSDTTLVESGDAIIPGKPAMVSRYRLGTRINHWVTAITMVLLVLSGLAMFHPSLFFLSAIFGSGQNTRAFHPWLGVILSASFLGLFIQFWRSNLWTSSDTGWVTHMGDLLGGHEERMPEVGKYNAGQKFVFWAMALLIVVLLGTGILIWQEYSSRLASIETQRLALWGHALAAIAVILVLILHVYAAIWVRGSIDAMIQGDVPVGWAWRHHRKWLRQLVARKEIVEKRSGQ